MMNNNITYDIVTISRTGDMLCPSQAYLWLEQ